MECSHPLARTGRCPREGRPLVCYYHQKILDGLLQPAADVLAPLELEATMEGRLHGDGRRLDAYVLETHRLAG